MKGFFEEVLVSEDSDSANSTDEEQSTGKRVKLDPFSEATSQQSTERSPKDRQVHALKPTRKYAADIEAFGEYVKAVMSSITNDALRGEAVYGFNNILKEIKKKQKDQDS